MQIFRLRKYPYWRISLGQGSWTLRRTSRRKWTRGTSLSRLIFSSASFDSETLLSPLESVLFGTRFGSGTRRLAWGEFYQGSLFEAFDTSSSIVLSQESNPITKTSVKEDRDVGRALEELPPRLLSTLCLMASSIDVSFLVPRSSSRSTSSSIPSRLREEAV